MVRYHSETYNDVVPEWLQHSLETMSEGLGTDLDAHLTLPGPSHAVYVLRVYEAIKDGDEFGGYQTRGTFYFNRKEARAVVGA